MPTLVFSPETCVKRELLLNEFAKENIDTRVFFWPLSSFKMFEEKKNNRKCDIQNDMRNLQKENKVNIQTLRKKDPQPLFRGRK